MNYHYLLNHTATSIYTSARMYDRDYCLLELCRMDPDLNDNHLVATFLSEPIFHRSHEGMPLIFSVNDTLFYAWVETPEHFFLLGPTLFTDYSSSGRTDPIQLNTDISLPQFDLEELREVIPNCTLQILADDVVLLHNIECEGSKQYLSTRELIEANTIKKGSEDSTIKTMYQTMFDKVENSFAHNPFNHEKLEKNYVKTGDPESLKTLLQERFPGRYGRLSDDPIKQEIYLAIVAITIATRAAIEGGVHPETAFYLSDVAIHRIGVCRDVNEIIRLTVDTEIQCAQMVAEIKQKQNDDVSSEENQHISRCKDYIFAHMHGKITVKEIASAIGLETNYLSALFKKCEKKTLKNYINEEKVKLIKNLLTYSSYSYIEIATYLGFSSQSHMGMEFKRFTGMTPGEYRSKYVREDFLKESMEDY